MHVLNMHLFKKEHTGKFNIRRENLIALKSDNHRFNISREFDFTEL